jgi:hypothetical protein
MLILWNTLYLIAIVDDSTAKIVHSLYHLCCFKIKTIHAHAYDLDNSLGCARNYRVDNPAESAIWSNLEVRVKVIIIIIIITTI